MLWPIGVFVDNRDSKLRPFVYVVVFPARVKVNGNRPVTGGLDTVINHTMACCGCLLARPESPGDQTGEIRPDTLVVLIVWVRLAGIENLDAAVDIAGRGCGKRAVNAHSDRQVWALPDGTGRRYALKRNHRARRVVLLRDAAVFLDECFAGLRHFGKRGEEGKFEQRNSY